LPLITTAVNVSAATTLIFVQLTFLSEITTDIAMSLKSIRVSPMPVKANFFFLTVRNQDVSVLLICGYAHWICQIFLSHE